MISLHKSLSRQHAKDYAPRILYESLFKIAGVGGGEMQENLKCVSEGSNECSFLKLCTPKMSNTLLKNPINFKGKLHPFQKYHILCGKIL